MVNREALWEIQLSDGWVRIGLVCTWSRLYGEPIEAVTVYKQRHIRYTAEVFLLARHLHDVRIRFDVVEVMMAPGRAVRLRHTRNAF